MEWSLAIVALALLGVAAISRRLPGTPITPAMLFVAVGVLVGPEVLDGIDLSSRSATVRALAEATLALVLFCDASRIDLGQLRREAGLPLRLLGIGLPLTIALGALAAAVVFDQLSDRGGGDPGRRAGADRRGARTGGRHRAARPGADPPGTQRRERAQRRDLRAAAVRGRRGGRRRIGDLGGRSPATLLLEEIGYGVIGGVVGGLAVAAIVIYGGRRDLIDGAWRQVIPIAGAALAYGIAAALGGSGFIAAFVAGMTFRLALKPRPGEINELSEQVGNVLNGVTFVLFGAILLGPALAS